MKKALLWIVLLVDLGATLYLWDSLNRILGAALLVVAGASIYQLMGTRKLMALVRSGSRNRDAAYQYYGSVAATSDDCDSAPDSESDSDSDSDSDSGDSDCGSND